MKKYILIATVALLGFSSCQKETTINNYNGIKELPSSTTPIIVDNSKKYNHDEVYIRSNDWVIVGRYDSPINGSEGQWLLQVKDTNNYLIIDPAPANMYWKAEYAKGAILPGFQVIKFNIKKV